MEQQLDEPEVDYALISEFIAIGIRMELCFDELYSFNNKGKFVFKHPFLLQKDERKRLLQLLRTSPDRYFEERKNIELNITRYTSQMNSKSLSAEKKTKAQFNLDRYNTILQLYKEVFHDFTTGGNT